MKKMLKILVVTLLSLTVIAALTGCGGKKAKEVSVDVASLASQLNGFVTSDSLTKQESQDMIKSIYYIDDASFASGAAYLSDGTTACEVAVIDCGDASKASGVADKLKSRVSSQKELYASYNADEAGRLDKAIIKTADKYAVLAVVDDTAKAEDALKSAGF